MHCPVKNETKIVKITYSDTIHDRSKAQSFFGDGFYFLLCTSSDDLPTLPVPSAQADQLLQLEITERRCSSGQLHFEKTTGYELIRGNPSRLFSDRDGGIIGDCAGRCESDSRCMGFNMDYNRNECQAVTTTSENNLFNLRPASGSSYFGGVCLKGNY